jgi:hypothetical protein
MTGRVYRFLHQFPSDRFREPVPIGSIGSEFSIFLRFIGSRLVHVVPVPGSPTFRWEPERTEALARCVCRAHHVNARAPRDCHRRLHSVGACRRNNRYGDKEAARARRHRSPRRDTCGSMTAVKDEMWSAR